MAHGRNHRTYPSEILALNMYHPTMNNREQAETYIRQNHRGIGSYIVRPNTNNDPGYVSVTTSITEVGDSCHARVYIDWNGRDYEYYFIEKIKFHTFCDLLEYYQCHRIHCQQGIDNIRLQHALIHQGLPVDKNGRHIGGGSSGSGRRRTQSHNDDRGDSTGSSGSDTRPGARALPVPPDQRHQAGVVGPHGSRLITRQSEKVIGSKQLIKKRANSASQIKLPSAYTNSKAIQEDPKSFMKCRPPAPLPRQEKPADEENVYYSHVDADKNFFEETYRSLKAADLCECGLRIMHSSLPLGWTVHRSRDEATFKHIFFQYGQTTTWDMPKEIVHHLNAEQIQFILFLCQDGGIPVPRCLRKRLDQERGWQKAPASLFQSTLWSSSSSLGGESVVSRSSSKQVQFSVTSPEGENPTTDTSNSPSTGDHDPRASGYYERPGDLLIGAVGQGDVTLKEAQENNLSPDTAWSGDGERVRNGIGRPESPRPVSFGSIPTTTIPTKVGSPTTSLPPADAAPDLRQEFDQLELKLREEQAKHIALQQQWQDLQTEVSPIIGNPTHNYTMAPQSLPKVQLHHPLQQQPSPQQPQPQVQQQNNLSEGQNSLDKFLDSQTDTRL